MVITPTSSFTRPADTTQYASGDLVADSATAGSVTPLTFGLQGVKGNGTIRRARLYKSATSATAATFNLHLFTAAPVVTNGDNGAFAVDTAANYIGKIAIDMSSGGLAGTAYLFQASAAIAMGVQISDVGDFIYGLLEAGGTYTPGSGEAFKVTLEIED